jgi:hypothetical protein
MAVNSSADPASGAELMVFWPVRAVSLSAAKIGLNQARRHQHPVQPREVEALEHTAGNAEPAERRGHIGYGLREEGVAPPEQAGHFAHPRELTDDPGKVVGGTASPHPGRPHRAHGQRGHQLHHVGELDGVERVRALLRRQRRRGAALQVGRHPVRHD